LLINDVVALWVCRCVFWENLSLFVTSCLFFLFLFIFKKKKRMRDTHLELSICLNISVSNSFMKIHPSMYTFDLGRCMCTFDFGYHERF
jgi:hypothetical protein